MHGIHSLRAPEPLGDPFWNYVVPGDAFVFVFEGYSWNVSRRALNSRRRAGATLRQVDPAIARLERAVKAFDPAITRIYFEAEALRSAIR